MKILNVNVDSFKLKEALNALDDKQIILTPNPEILLEARKNKKFRQALRRGTMMLADGHGLLFVSTLLKFKTKFIRLVMYFPLLFLFIFWKKPFKKVIPEVIHGSDFMAMVISWAEVEGKSVFFLGGKEGVAQRTAEYFRSQHKKLKIAGYSALDPSFEAYEFVKWSDPDVVFVAYGAPKQELWIAKYAPKLKEVHTFMAVGGSFDFWSGKVKRAPKFMRRIGVEWIWRLVINPRKRLRRIWNAFVIFPIISLFFSS